MKAQKKIIIVLFITLFFIKCNIINAQNDDKYINIITKKTYYYDGGVLDVEIDTNYNFINLTISNNNGFSYTFLNKINGWSREISLNDADFGYYKIDAYNGENHYIKYITIINNDNWKNADFPISTIHKNIKYTFYQNGTLKAQTNKDTMFIDFMWIKTLSRGINTTKTFTYNNMNLRGSWINEDLNYMCNVTFIRVYEGLKMIIYIDTPNKIIFDYSFRDVKNILNGFRENDINFEYSDILKFFKDNCYVDKTHKKVYLILDKGVHEIDPILFLSGYETGDFSEWGGVYTGDGGVYSVQNSSIIHGYYSANFSDTSYSGVTASWKTISGVIKKANITCYFRFENEFPDEVAGYKEFEDNLIIRSVAHSVYKDVVSVGISYNSTHSDTRIHCYFNNSLNRNNENFIVELDTTYRFMVLLDIEKNYCVLYVDDTKIFNKTYEFGNSEIDYVYAGLRSTNKRLNDRFDVIVDSYNINTDEWVFTSQDYYIYFHVRSFEDIPIQNVNITLYDLNNYFLDYKISNDEGLCIFDNDYDTTTINYVAFNSVVGKYDNFNNTKNTHVNITKNLMPFIGLTRSQIIIPENEIRLANILLPILLIMVIVGLVIASRNN